MKVRTAKRSPIMHVKCPYCQGVVNTGEWTRFKVFECPHCEFNFRGLHATPSRRWLLWDWLNPFSVACFDNWDHTACPSCGWMIRIYRSDEHTGFDNPSTCSSCCRGLPTWEDDNGPRGIYEYLNWHLRPSPEDDIQGVDDAWEPSKQGQD